ncbi:MAG: transposase, partial [Odoribacter sp.]|nr:transposase [Odoribacter sp.]
MKYKKNKKKGGAFQYQTILNYFDYRSTNAAVESFNAKIKEFRRVFRGIRDIKFFLFRPV